MSNIIEEVKQLGEQIVKRKQKKISSFLSLLEDPEIQELVDALRNGHATSVKEHKFSAGLTTQIMSLRSQLPTPFQVPDVQKLLEERSFRFNSSDHHRAIRDALLRMVQQKLVRVVEKGRGGKPSSYSFI